MKVVDIASWKRKEHFEFFSKMKSPYFGFTTEVDCTKAYEKAKENGHSFFAYYLHKSMVAVNSVEELKLRIVGDQVILYDEVHGGSTIGRADGTFGFSFFHYSEDFETFNQGLQKEIQSVQNSTGLGISNDVLPINHIRHTTIPWNSFSALLHPPILIRKNVSRKSLLGSLISVTERNSFLFLLKRIMVWQTVFIWPSILKNFNDNLICNENYFFR